MDATEVFFRDSSSKTPAAATTDRNIPLSLSRNYILNTIISSPDHEIVYEISTPNHFFNLSTTITRLDKSSGQRTYAGEIRWKAFTTLVRIGLQGEWMQVNDFLVNKKSKLSSARSFVGNQGVRYRWKTRGHTLQMCQDCQDDATENLPPW